MASLQVIERDIFIATLLGSSDIRAVVGDRVVWEFIGRFGKVKYPYIRVSLKYGGYTNVTNTRETKSYWQVTGICDDSLTTAESVLNAIHDTLHSKFPTIPTKYTQIQTTYKILEEHSIFRAFKYHNEPVYDVGGMYCLRMALCEVE